MSSEYEEDLEMYQEAAGPTRRQLDNRALLRPIGYLNFPKHPLSTAPDTPVRDALERMGSKNIGAILVVDEGRVVGIFSERDALRKGLFRDSALGARPVKEFMTPEPDCLTPHDNIAFAMNRMGIGGYRHIPLVDAEKRPVGMLVMRDLVQYVARFFPNEALNVPPHSDYNPPERNADGG